MHYHYDSPFGYKSGQSVRMSERLDYIVGYCVASLILGLTEEATPNLITDAQPPYSLSIGHSIVTFSLALTPSATLLPLQGKNPQSCHFPKSL